MTSSRPVRPGPRNTGADRERSDPGRHETPEERADRLWGDILQEVRVCQTGAQILFGFLLSVVFTDRFGSLSEFDRHLYVVTVLFGAAATGALIAPVAIHRFLAGRGLKPELVHVAARLVVTGLVLLALTLAAALLLLLRTATGGSPVAWVLTGAVLLWFATCWLLLPRHLLRSRTRPRADRDERRPPRL
ncbi:DUF6328 family protein [Kitasatospora paracochleata]|uniref:Integral membrane protein n=1 Tax=Kitasatospora paracochleata TaxID=58354 RepID=A0ABT1J2L7_9ACTN|nr:DUF6328 family protein [Kitasatospora paracochleata]MCP2311675.1 hypothetical protein [Kitasatospora paracochleata]